MQDLGYQPGGDRPAHSQQGDSQVHTDGIRPRARGQGFTNSGTLSAMPASGWVSMAP